MRTTYQVANAREQQLAAARTFGATDDVQLALAGICYAEHAALWCDESIDLAAYRATAPGPLWPWNVTHWAPSDPRQDLERAAAMIIAQVDLLDLARREALAVAPTVELAQWRQDYAPGASTRPGCFRVRTIHEVANVATELCADSLNRGPDDDVQLALAGIAYAEHAALWADENIDLADYRAADPGDQWPWKAVLWAPTTPRGDLVRAAALIIAQIKTFDHVHLEWSAAGD